MKPVYSFRLDETLVEKAKKAGLNIVKLIEGTIAKALKDKRCPYCGQTKGKKHG